MRKIISDPKDRVTQGTIFSGVQKSYNTPVECYGIAITARCDTARDFKVPVLNFLPIISFEDWLWFEALPKCKDKVKKTALGNLKKYLLDKDGSSITLDAFGAEQAFNRPDCIDKSFISAKTLYDEALLIDRIDLYDWKSLPKKSIGKELTAAAKDVVLNKNQEFFFIEKIDILSNQKTTTKLGYVVLLREIRSLSRHAALMLKKGLNANNILLDLKDDYCKSQFNLDFHEMAFPISELNSPYIEQLMQSFSNLFSRIGVPDVDDSMHERIAKFIEG